MRTTGEEPLEIVVDAGELFVHPGREGLEEIAVEHGPEVASEISRIWVVKQVAVQLEPVHGPVDAEDLVGRGGDAVPARQAQVLRDER